LRISVCPGSFDPITRGHVNVVKRAAKLFDKIIVLVSDNVVKTPKFTLEERVEMTRLSLRECDNVEVKVLKGLLASYAKEEGACAIIRGLRAVSDFDYEFQMALANKNLNPDIETVFLTASSGRMFISSSLVKQIAKLGGDITGFVPECVAEKIKQRLLGSL